MADKVVTLVQDKTGDNIYPNIKKENLPIDLYTTAQRQSLNSGITSEKVKQYDTYETSKVNKADVGSVITNLIQQKEGGILSIAGSVLTNADGKLIKGPISQDVYSKDKVDELVGSASSSDTAVITLSDSQALEIQDNKITFTQEQVDIIKKSSAVSFTYNNQEIIKGYVSHLIMSTLNIYQITSIHLYGWYMIAFTDENFLQQLDITVVEFASNFSFIIDSEKSFNLFDPDANIESDKVYFDTINGAGIVHDRESKVKNYTIKQYFNHDIRILFNGSILMLNIVNTSNTPIDSITDIKTAYGSRTQVMMTGIFQDDDLMRVVSSYNPQTNKITTSSTTGALGAGDEILLATHTVGSNDYALGSINDTVTLI